MENNQNCASCERELIAVRCSNKHMICFVCSQLCEEKCNVCGNRQIHDESEEAYIFTNYVEIYYDLLPDKIINHDIVKLINILNNQSIEHSQLAEFSQLIKRIYSEQTECNKYEWFLLSKEGKQPSIMHKIVIKKMLNYMHRKLLIGCRDFTDHDYEIITGVTRLTTDDLLSYKTRSDINVLHLMNMTNRELLQVFKEWSGQTINLQLDAINSLTNSAIYFDTSEFGENIEKHILIICCLKTPEKFMVWLGEMLNDYISNYQSNYYLVNVYHNLGSMCGIEFTNSYKHIEEYSTAINTIYRTSKMLEKIQGCTIKELSVPASSLLNIIGGN